MAQKIFALLIVAFFSLTAFSQKTELMVQLGHTDAVSCTAFNSDASYIISGSNDHTVKLWNVQSGLLIRTYYGLRKPVKGVLFDAAEQNIIAVDEDGKLMNWALDGQVVFQQKLLADISSIAASADKKTILISADKTLYKYDVVKRQFSDSIHGDENMKFARYANEDNTLFAVVDDNTNTALYISKNGSVKKIIVKDASIHQFCFLPGGKQIAWCGGGYMFGGYGVIDITTGETIWSVKNIETGFEGIDALDDGRLAIGSAINGMVYVVNSSTGKLLTNLAVQSGAIASINSFTKGSIFLTACSDRSIKLWNAATVQPLKSFASISDYIWSISLGSDGKTLAAAGGALDKEQSIKMWDISRGKLLRRVNDINSMMLSCALSPNMKWLAGGSVNGESAWWEMPETYNSGYVKGNKKISSVSFQARSNYFIAGTDDGKILLHRVKLNKAETLESNKEGVSSVAFSNDGNYFLAGTHAGTTELWDFNKKAKINEWPTHTDVGNFFDTAVYIPYSSKFRMNIGTIQGPSSASVTSVAFSSDGKIIAAGGASLLMFIDAATGKTIRSVEKLNGICNITFAKKSNLVAVGCADHFIRIVDAATGSVVSVFDGHDNEVRSVQFSNDDKFLISASLDTQIKIWEVSTGKMMLGMLSLTNSNEYIIYNSNGYYLSSKGAGRVLAFRIGNDVYPFSQFDIKYNRPDIIIEELNHIFYDGVKNSPLQPLQQAYKTAYNKRLKKMNFREEDLTGDLHVPSITINKSSFNGDILNLEVKASDTKYAIDRLQVYVNEVPFYGSKGFSVRQQNSKAVTQQISIPLTEGDNNIQVSCINEKGSESFRTTMKAMNTTVEKSNTYVVAISVSRYKDSTMNLNYAVKDGSDMCKYFSSSSSNVFVDSFFNEKAVLENIRNIKQKLLTTKANDKVIVFVSGHGMLDKDYNFYFATHDINFSDPATRGLSYDELERLLDGIPARKKLLLIDACHSGEVDSNSSDSAVASSSTETNASVKTYSFRSSVKNIKTKESLGLQNSFELMQQLFTNLSQGSGALVISAAAGVGYALESQEWNNGLFTYTVLNSLKNKLGDENKNGHISINELKNFVTKEVEKLSKGQQKPTTRKELLEWDWELVP